MTQYLPPNLLALFAARDPIPFLPPVDKLPYEKKTAGYNGIAAFVNQFEDPADTPPPMKIETRDQRQERKRRAKAELAAYKLEQDIALWNPSKNANATMDPYKTLFVARINYDTSESKLKREFEVYGNIKKLVYVHNPETNKPRGYAFIEYERERDMHSAYKHADGRKIDGRRVLVDVERGRTVQGWFPRRLGGGLGGTRRGGPDVNVKHSGREEPRNEERHYMERAERPERRRSRSRSRERRRKSRSRSRDRHRRDRHKRERSRERDRNRDHDAKAADGMDASAMGGPDMEPSARKERRRSRSRDRDSRRKRSRSKERKRRDHDRGDRDSRRSERDRGGDRGDRDERKPLQPPTPPMPEEPSIPDPMMGDMYNNQGYNEGDYNNYSNNNNNNNNSMEANNYEGY